MLTGKKPNCAKPARCRRRHAVRDCSLDDSGRALRNHAALHALSAPARAELLAARRRALDDLRRHRLVPLGGCSVLFGRLHARPRRARPDAVQRLLALALFGAIGCAFADNLLTLYLFYEIVSVTTYPLVAHHQDEEGYEGAKKYSST